LFSDADQSSVYRKNNNKAQKILNYTGQNPEEEMAEYKRQNKNFIEAYFKIEDYEVTRRKFIITLYSTKIKKDGSYSLKGNMRLVNVGAAKHDNKLDVEKFTEALALLNSHHLFHNNLEPQNLIYDKDAHSLPLLNE